MRNKKKAKKSRLKNSAWAENRSGFRHVSILLKKEEKKLRIDYSCQFRQGSYSLGYFDHSVKIKAVHSVFFRKLPDCCGIGFVHDQFFHFFMNRHHLINRNSSFVSGIHAFRAALRFIEDIVLHILFKAGYRAFTLHLEKVFVVKQQLVKKR